MTKKRSLRGCPCKVGASKKKCGIRGLGGKCVPRGTRGLRGGLRGTITEHRQRAREYLRLGNRLLKQAQRETNSCFKHTAATTARDFAVRAQTEIQWVSDSPGVTKTAAATLRKKAAAIAHRTDCPRWEGSTITRKR